MQIIAAALAIVATVAVTSTARSQTRELAEVCRSLAEPDTFTVVTDARSWQRAHHFVCSSESQARDSRTNAQMEAAYKLVSGGAAFSQQNIEQYQRQSCSRFDREDHFRMFTFLSAQALPSPRAQQVVECLRAIQGRDSGFFCSGRRLAPDSIEVELSYQPNTAGPPSTFRLDSFSLVPRGIEANGPGLEREMNLNRGTTRFLYSLPSDQNFLAVINGSVQPGGQATLAAFLYKA